jgi:hypothetical protein
MTCLLWRYRTTGILDGLLTVLTGAAENGRALETAIIVNEDEQHDKGVNTSRPVQRHPPILLGKDRAGDIIVNVLLPFYAAYASLRSAPGLAQKAAAVYHGYRGPVENSLERHMRRQLGLTAAVTTARRRQGLIHIYKTLCTQGRCGECPAKNDQTKK